MSYYAKGFWVQNLADKQGRPYKTLIRATVLSDHKFDTREIPNFVPEEDYRVKIDKNEDFPEGKK